MNGEDSQSGRDGTVEADDNVIRLTDWLGPREELIPFGPGADAEEASRVPTAADFWSESSGAVQDALSAPRSDTVHEAPLRRARGPGRATAAAIWSRRRAALQSPETARDRPRLDRRLGWAAGTGMAAIATAVLVVALAGAGSPHSRTDGRRTSPAAPQASSGSVRARDMATASQALMRHTRAQAGSASASQRHGARVRHRLPHRRPRLRRGVPRSAVAAQPVGYTTPVSGSPTYSTPSRSTPPPSSTPTTSNPTATASTGQGNGSSHPALGASGSLAPGSSPDG